MIFLHQGGVSSQLFGPWTCLLLLCFLSILISRVSFLCPSVKGWYFSGFCPSSFFMARVFTLPRLAHFLDLEMPLIRHCWSDLHILLVCEHPHWEHRDEAGLGGGDEAACNQNLASSTISHLVLQARNLDALHISSLFPLTSDQILSEPLLFSLLPPSVPLNCCCLTSDVVTSTWPSPPPPAWSFSSENQITDSFCHDLPWLYKLSLLFLPPEPPASSCDYFTPCTSSAATPAWITSFIVRLVACYLCFKTQLNLCSLCEGNLHSNPPSSPHTIVLASSTHRGSAGCGCGGWECSYLKTHSHVWCLGWEDSRTWGHSRGISLSFYASQSENSLTSHTAVQSSRGAGKKRGREAARSHIAF